METSNNSKTKVKIVKAVQKFYGLVHYLSQEMADVTLEHESAFVERHLGIDRSITESHRINKTKSISYLQKKKDLIRRRQEEIKELQDSLLQSLPEDQRESAKRIQAIISKK